MNYFVVTHIPQGITAAGRPAQFTETDSNLLCGYSAISKVAREIVDNTTIMRDWRVRVQEIRADPLRTLEEIDCSLQQKAAEVIDAWKNQPAFSSSSALAQIRRNLKR
jgi:hypothetical protein